MIVGKPLLATSQIQTKVRELADRISEDYLGKDLIVVGVLKGAFMFFSDIVRAIKVPLTLDFIIASSYVKTETTGEVKIFYNVREDITDKDVLLIDDFSGLFHKEYLMFAVESTGNIDVLQCLLGVHPPRLGDADYPVGRERVLRIDE